MWLRRGGHSEQHRRGRDRGCDRLLSPQRSSIGSTRPTPLISSFGYVRGGSIHVVGGRIQWRVAESLVGPLTYVGCIASQARSGDRAARSGCMEVDPTDEVNCAPPASNGGGGPWMGSESPWMSLAGLSMSFLFFYAINRAGQTTASEKVLFTMTFRPRRLR